MEKHELKSQASQQWAEMRTVYAATKRLLILSEEKLQSMKLYPAPLLEHRDALDHIMSYSKIVAESGLCESAIHELANAKQHEIRAFYDVADYICISIRQEISDTLNVLSKRQISAVWPEYRDVRAQAIEISSQIAEIRNGTRESVHTIPIYEKAVDAMFEIYKQYLLDVQPKIGHGFFYKFYRLLKGEYRL